MFAAGKYWPSEIVWTIFFHLLFQETIYDAFILFFFKYWMEFISEVIWTWEGFFSHFGQFVLLF